MSSSPSPTSAPPPSNSPPSPSSNSTSPPPQPLSAPPPSATASPPPNSTAPPPSSAPPSPPLPLNPSPPNSSTPPENPSGSSGSGRSPPASGISPPAPHSSSSSTSTGLVVGLVVGGVVLLLLLCISWICCYRKKRRSGPLPQQYYAAPPSRKDESYEQHQNWHSAAPTDDHVIKLPPNPSPPPPFASRPRPPPGPGNYGVPPSVASNSGSSGLNYSGSDNSPVPPSPGASLGLPKSTFTYKELAMATDGFSNANLLGQGGFGYVHRGMLPSGKEVAVKQLKSGSGQGEREFQAEVEIISRVHHRYLVSLVGYCIAEGKRLLVYEFVPNNTLEFHLHGRERPPLDWPTRLKVALGSAKGLAYLHEDCHPKIIHRDIKASNILLDFKFEAKVADFGLAKIASETDTHVSTRVMGTFGYLAPEYASSGKLTDKSDVFSFGVMLLELITGRPPFDSSQSFMDDSLVDWARPLLTRALDDGSFDSIVDPRLGKDYNRGEMRRMIACAAASVRHSAKLRPRMSQIVRALEGDISLEDLTEGVKPGHSSVYGSYTSSDYDAMQYNEDMRKFRKMALASEEYGNTEFGLGLKQSGSSGESRESRDAGELNIGGRVKEESRGF